MICSICLPRILEPTGLISAGNLNQEIGRHSYRFLFLFLWFTTSVCNYLHVLYSLLKTLHIIFFDRIFYKGALFSCTVLGSAASSLHAVPTTT